MSGLTADLARELFSYEPDTGILRWRKPGGSKRKSLVAGTRTHGYLSVHVFGRQYQVHRVAWLYVKGAWPNNQIDHINGILVKRFQVWDIVEEYDLDYFDGSILAYLLRRKPGVPRAIDLRKAQHYLAKCLEREEAKNGH